MIHPGLLSVTFRRLGPREIVALAAQAGLAGIEWGGDVHVPHGNLGRAREVRAMTVDAGLNVSAYGSYYRVGVSETTPDGPRWEQVIETARELDAPIIRVWAGYQGSAETGPADRGLVIGESFRIAEQAAQAGLTVSYEYHGGTLTDTNESAGALLEEVDHPAVRTFWQPLTEKPTEYCLAGLRSILPRLSHVHVFHWWPTARDRRPLTDGEIAWSEYLELIRSAEGDRFASLEFVRGDSPEQFREDAATLKQWLGDR